MHFHRKRNLSGLSLDTFWQGTSHGLNYKRIYSLFFRAAFELGRHEWFALRRLITKLEMLHIPEFLNFCSSRNLTSGRNNGRRNGQWEGYSTGQYVFWRPPTVRQFKMAPITTEIITPRYGLTMFWLFSVISLQYFLRWEFRNIFLRNKACVYLLLNFSSCKITKALLLSASGANLPAKCHVILIFRTGTPHQHVSLFRVGYL